MDFYDCGEIHICEDCCYEFVKILKGFLGRDIKAAEPILRDTTVANKNNKERD